MENNLTERLAAQDRKLEEIFVSVEKTRKYLLIIMWSSLLMVALPLLAGAVLVPIILSSFSGYSDALLGF